MALLTSQLLEIGPAFAQAIIIGIAGAHGALARYLLGRFITEKYGSRIPYGTLIINISGAFVIGLLSALAARQLLSSQLQAILATGFLGGYTTFSTMNWENFQLAREGQIHLSMLYLRGSILLGLGAAAAGLFLGWEL
jgi:CrcB protein